MRLNFSTSSIRTLSLSIPFTLAALVGCFRGGDVGLTGESGTESESGTTGPVCEVGTEGCPCTTGNGCDPGLECMGGTCEPIEPVCPNGMIEPGEQCDDGNTDNSDACTTLCMPPSCSDGIVSGDEIAADCGIAACGVACEFGEPCTIANDCLFPVCGPDGDGNDICQFPRSCFDFQNFTPNAMDGNITIDPDGADGPLPAFDVFCNMSRGGGGWTLVFVSSDDGVNTWTWNNRAKLSNEPDMVGTLDELNRDFMSPAYHSLRAVDLLFIHQPSDVWAQYNMASMPMANKTLGDIILDAGSPVCDLQLAGNGIPLAAGTLTASGLLCDTDLYFNLGDHEMFMSDPTTCTDFGSGSNTASFGPVWSASKAMMCPFDDPAEYGLGPHGPCGACPANFPSTEFGYLGYGNALNLNSGAAGQGENYMQIYVR